MNQEPAETFRIDERLLDLLVDGELDPVQQKDLFARLDGASDGWRRCVLAFLEAQAWRRDLVGAAREPVATAARSPGALARRQPLARRLRNGSLVALSVACAFVAGWFTRPAPDAPAGAAPVAVVPVAPSETTVEHPDNVSPPTVAANSPDESPSADESASVRIAGVVTLKFDDHGQEREMKLPVLEGSGIDVGQWLTRPPAISAAAVHELQRHGHKVETHRQLLTLNLKDGRKLLLPVDQVDVRFAHRVYQ